MVDIRAIVLARISALGLTPYRVADAVRPRIGERTVYRYLAGETELRSDNLAILLDALGLEIRETTK